MRIVFICIVFCGIVLQLTGCWVRFEANGHPEYSYYVGKHAETKADLRYSADVPFYLGPPVAFPADRCAGRKKFVVVPAGTRLDIIGISTRRIESGKWYYFECRYETGGEKVLFDYPISKRYLKVLHFEFK